MSDLDDENELVLSEPIPPAHRAPFFTKENAKKMAAMAVAKKRSNPTRKKLGKKSTQGIVIDAVRRVMICKVPKGSGLEKYLEKSGIDMKGEPLTICSAMVAAIALKAIQEGDEKRLDSLSRLGGMHWDQSNLANGTENNPSVIKIDVRTDAKIIKRISKELECGC